ncbi:VOC family protein [Nostoc sp. FACHB-110]|uniref:VOC family protein n=1 Tax=Nostoc sp. FACHB-110 TaxID=2692834 RepID=UPI001688238F|nr:hypothetical protein [Nostoc sp. FACHB-110]MBD2435907.1 hypothetical protein [Nostoc sp. FACHB-110]
MENSEQTIQGSKKNPFTRRRQLLMGGSFLAGLVASTTGFSTLDSKPALGKDKDEDDSLELSGKWKKKKIHRIEGPGLHHSALLAYDIDATIRFYEKGFNARKRYGWNSAQTILPNGELFDVVRRVQLMDIGDGNYVEIVAGGTPANQRVGYDIWNHLALRADNTDFYYQRAINAGAKPFNFVFNGKTWNGEPANFILSGDINGQANITVRLAYCQGLDGELIEMVQGNIL